MTEVLRGFNQDDFNELYDTYRPRLVASVGKIVGENDAEDVAQETFLKAFQARDRYDWSAEGNSALLHTFGKNLAVDKLRKQRREAFVTNLVQAGDDQDGEPSDGISRIPFSGPGPLQQTILDENISELDKALASLQVKHPNQAYAISRHYLEGVTYAEIANEIGVPINTVKTWMYRGRSFLANAFGQTVHKPELGVYSLNKLG